MSSSNIKSIPDPVEFLSSIYIEEVEELKMLDFDDIQEITRENRNRKFISRREEPKMVTLTEDEDKIINGWIKDLEKYIVNWALTRKGFFDL